MVIMWLRRRADGGVAEGGAAGGGRKGGNREMGAASRGTQRASGCTAAG